ncbi:MAG: DUF4197 domain-containing protein [Saprospiraceae bacterium]|nr:DUF4197 domain-containing protein [Saprospiraceae bacterium]HMW38439.1 DUF4197 domain-containing protein [Saprospiraceae bacterium]HMX87591.1 DUF4197 domain-containing protein [Saprospiraceae bacterium]HMZ40902.1 DUF4197 domain-containing protein [Saprospiraceae bacterium]HNA65037.1 DUF4197 domain-containing protein [Saprospiraceae bacterium]
MKKITSLILAVVALSFNSCSGQFGKLLKTVGLDEISSEEVASGLKEALSQGTSKGADLLSAKDGYFKSIYKIALPEDAKSVCNKLAVIPGFNSIENDVVEKINRAAEDAAVKAKPIFINAIRQMTIQDAWNILKGQDNAATQFLQKTTYQSLYNEFKPVISGSMEKVGALQLWSSAVNKYNQIPLVKKANPDMSDYVTNKALEGLFRKIAEEELNIRHNLAARTTDLLKKVFSKQDK